MSWTDPIADMLTRIRNAHMAGQETVEIPASRLKAEIARILKAEGFVRDYAVSGEGKKTITVTLKYTGDHEPAITGIKRESTPGLRRYVTAREIPQVLGGMGVMVISTSRGIMTGKDAEKAKVGGELVCSVW